MDWSWHCGKRWEGLRSSWRCLCCCKVALVKLECLQVETGRFQICAAGEVNIYAKVSCETQEVERTVSKAARGRLGSGHFGPIQFISSTTSCMSS